MESDETWPQWAVILGIEHLPVGSLMSSSSINAIAGVGPKYQLSRTAIVAKLRVL